MLTALVSTIAGLVSGSLPDFLKEWKSGREHGREVELLEVQTRLQLDIAKVESAGKIAELDRQVDIAGYQAQAKIAVASLANSGIAWVDAWNAGLRPFAATIIIVLFAVMASFYTYCVLIEVNSLADARLSIELLWGSLIGEAIQAVLGFLFGYRSAVKK
jgi:hypothetical protein